MVYQYVSIKHSIIGHEKTMNFPKQVTNGHCLGLKLVNGHRECKTNRKLKLFEWYCSISWYHWDT